jgi:hypothetical protein
VGAGKNPIPIKHKKGRSDDLPFLVDGSLG